MEIARRGFEAWNAGDMGAYAELFDTDAVVRPPARWPERGPFLGRDAVRFLEQLRDAWDTDLVEPISDFVDAGDRVVMRLAWSGQGQGPAAVMEMSAVLTIRNGKVLSFEFFWDHAEALEAIGLQG